MGGGQLIWQAHVLFLHRIHERPALNTLLLGCCLDAHAQLRLGKPASAGASREGVCWGREAEAEAECGSKTFSCSHVPQGKRPMARPPVWSPKVYSTCSLAGNHVQVISPLRACEDPFPYPPIVLLETLP